MSRLSVLALQVEPGLDATCCQGRLVVDYEVVPHTSDVKD